MANHTPLRMCIGCRQMVEKKNLIKIVSRNGLCELDRDQKKFGRGAYLCKNSVCIETARKKRALSKYFKICVPDGIYDEVKELLDG